MVADSALIDRLVARRQGIHASECAQVIDMLTFVGTVQATLAAARLAPAKLPSAWTAWQSGPISATVVGAIVDKARR